MLREKALVSCALFRQYIGTYNLKTPRHYVFLKYNFNINYTKL